MWDETGQDYAMFVKELGNLRTRADGAWSREEAFDVHMAIGRALYEHQLFKEVLVSFKRACELQPVDVRPHLRAGNCLYALGRHSEAKGEFTLALEAAENGGNQWGYLLPQIHVNLGIALEAEGMVINACEHYREAAILCPTHFRALKLLGSALFGVGGYKAAVKALEEAIFLKADYADAHCDMASALHAIGDDEKAVQVFQQALDLKPGHVDALYNMGGLYMEMSRYQRASEMYTRVLAVSPNHWRAEPNKAVALLGAGETEEALKITNRVELHDAVSHLKQLQRKKIKTNGGVNGEGAFNIVETSKFKRVADRTSLRQELSIALEIRAFQRVTRLTRCDVELLKKEMANDFPVSYSGSGAPEKSIRKAALEIILRKLLDFLKPDQGAVKAINEKIMMFLDESGSCRVDLGMFFAVLAPICGGSPEKRKQVAYDALLWRPASEGSSKIRKADALHYIKSLRAIYIPTRGLVKLESGDRTRHGNYACSVCRYPIIGSPFKEMKSHFSLCNQCYSEGKVRPSFKLEGYRFKEYASEAEAMKR
ncbi:hypothetical protein RJ641_028925 [Dillenia turbinata]|uniref:Uncharacterized protein n=1 Tax=Dillenia turbinata TaxID=194707 RepID=A0AAN8VX74_9MAGN